MWQDERMSVVVDNQFGWLRCVKVVEGEAALEQCHNDDVAGENNKTEPHIEAMTLKQSMKATVR